MRQRLSADDNKISVCIHEWGGYHAVRQKKLKVAEEFTCGLKFQLERFKNYAGNRQVDICLTLSEAWRKKEALVTCNVLEVGNEGMDFSGYAEFFETIREKPNHYVILTNTSVHQMQTEFLDSYIDYMEANDTVGVLGISYATKMYQSIIRNNFKPHAQSFFLLTTRAILQEIVDINGSFPGKGITDKRLLIRNAEIKLSGIVLKLGYEIALVQEDGSVFKYDSSVLSDNGRCRWTIPMGDNRAHVKNPNAINAIKSHNFTSNK
ncbi:hypothetical protein [Pedobacter suwonensis]|uniref:hypothetical protein n=1 Tax=Pedobacter suwonensis TaxID=332999 RepID=UPI001114093F|nr:hypothetical protein [Pedobacter suwonensis]